MISNGGAIALKDIPLLPVKMFCERIISDVENGSRIVSFFGFPEEGRTRLMAVLAGKSGSLTPLMADVSEKFPSLTPSCPQAHLFEREIWEQNNIIPEGHPWLKPIRFVNGGIGEIDFFTVEGEEVHEVAVGPVHAGIIEPGHFRFQCHGERVMHLEISLGYQHRGIEKALCSGPDKRTAHYMETLAGDTSIGHTTAYAMNIEALSDTQVPARGEVLRAVALELERIANHVGDLGALAGDVGYLPTASFCGRLRGDFLNITAQLCGNRFGRGLIRQGGVNFDADAEMISRISDMLNEAFKDVKDAVELLWKTPSVMGRFENTGILSREMCGDLGIVGPVARASGLERDVRMDYPFGIYRFIQIPVSTAGTGDVFARAQVRWLEIQRSVDFIQKQLSGVPSGSICADVGSLSPDSLSLSLVEGWRGEICHIVVTDSIGKFRVYKIVDPSFHNWMGLAMCLRGEEISDFPVCNKSFNLSYCGHDL